MTSTLVRTAPVGRSGAGSVLGRRRPLRLVTMKLAQWLTALGIVYVVWRWLVAPHVSKLFLVGPDPVLRKLGTWASDGTLWRICSLTLEESFIGLAFGTVVGVILALVAGLGPRVVAGLIDPVFAALYAMPKFAFIPLLLVWLGSGTGPRVLFVAITVLPIIYLNMATGLRTVDPARVRMVELFGGNRRQVATKLLIPHTAGYLGTALTISAHNSVASAIGAEILFGASNGLGGQMYTSAYSFDSASVIAALFAATVVSALYIGAFQILSRLGSAANANG
jgi:NitT/TauT family transport system permease protein